MLAREEKLTEIARRLQEAAGENLQSIVLYGSAARGDYHAHKSDLNLLCILKSAKAADLSQEIPASGRLTLVHVQAERREQEAVGIMVQHGANNSRIPAGTELVHGTIVDSTVEDAKDTGRDVIIEQPLDRGSTENLPKRA